MIFFLFIIISNYLLLMLWTDCKLPQQVEGKVS